MKIIINWTKVGRMIESLAKNVKNTGEVYDGVFGLPRGGLTIASALAYKLDLPILAFPTKNSLVVDDISDTGKSLQNLKYKHIACLFTTNWTITIPYFHISRKESKHDWITFPWELE